MKPLFVANWKMNKLQAQAEEFCKEFVEICALKEDIADIGIAPTFTAIPVVRNILSESPGIMLGAQNAHWCENGAHTGEVSPQMLAELGVEFVILGHSERRQFYGETSENVSKRAKAALSAHIKPIICIGETESEFKEGKTREVVKTQLIDSLKDLPDGNANVIIAYEPIWAIGTGLAATPEIAQNVHALVRSGLGDLYGEGVAREITILYGGSTKPNNIAELMSQKDIDGALVGGASLEPKSFAELIANGREA